MIIRAAIEQDWPRIYPFFSSIVATGQTYAFPEELSTGSFMVDPVHHGRGVGRALGRYVLDWARAKGYRSIQFNAVVETNTAAAHLWQTMGFQILTTVPEAFDHPERGLVGLHVMFQRLQPGHGGTRPAPASTTASRSTPRSQPPV